MGDLISVIVPAYNAAAYLRACLDSIRAQTYPDLEVLLVDDGSTDGTFALCDEYRLMDSRFRVIHQQNGGLSAARNTGIAAAMGAYLSFIDADDAVHPRFLETLHRAAIEERAEIALCGYQRFSDGMPIPDGYCTEARYCMSRMEAVTELTCVGKRSERMAVAWNKLYARRLFDTVRYPVGKWHEDEYVILPLLIQAEKIVNCDASLYFYRQRGDSITGETYQADIRHLDVLDALRQRCETLHTQEYRDIYCAVVSYYFEWLLYLAYRVARPAGIFRAYRGRYLKEMLRYGPWVRGKRFFVFAFYPRAYEKKHGL